MMFYVLNYAINLSVIFTPAENLAVDKPASQSSEMNPESGFARLAVDGWRLSTFADGSCTMTCGQDDEEWWSVDLLQSYLIRKLVVVNREDCCGKKIRLVFKN